MIRRLLLSGEPAASCGRYVCQYSLMGVYHRMK